MHYLTALGVLTLSFQTPQSNSPHSASFRIVHTKPRRPNSKSKRISSTTHSSPKFKPPNTPSPPHPSSLHSRYTQPPISQSTSPPGQPRAVEHANGPLRHEISYLTFEAERTDGVVFGSIDVLLLFFCCSFVWVLRDLGWYVL